MTTVHRLLTLSEATQSPVSNALGEATGHPADGRGRSPFKRCCQGKARSTQASGCPRNTETIDILISFRRFTTVFCVPRSKLDLRSKLATFAPSLASASCYGILCVTQRASERCN
jgi:hypothetical protein